MSDADLPELDATARALLSAGGGTIEPAPGAQDRVATRLAASIAALGPGGGGGGGGASATSNASTGTGTLPRVPMWVVGAAFVVGGAIGFGVHGAVAARDGSTSSTTVVTVAKTIEAPAPSASAVPSGSSEAVAVASVPAISPSSLPLAPDSSSATRFNHAADLSEERKILDDARAAFGRGDPDGAVAKARAHERRFPHGALSEERDALWVQALAQAGKSDEARARAAKFEQNYPESMLLPSVKAAAQSGRKVAP
jgi:hypothetical protein